VAGVRTLVVGIGTSRMAMSSAFALTREMAVQGRRQLFAEDRQDYGRHTDKFLPIAHANDV
jgi:hypothetical protein